MNYRALLLVGLVGLSAAPALANPEGTALKRIREARAIKMAHGEIGVPFSYITDDGPSGFGVDISKRIADAVKVHLGLRDLSIRWVPVSLALRFEALAKGEIDVECAATTNTSERRQMVAFSNTFYVSEEGITSKREAPIKGFADLVGKRVAVVGGTTTEHSLQNPEFKLTLVTERNDRHAMAAVVEGKADAYVAATPMIAGQLARLRDATAYQIVASRDYKEAFGCMLPKGDAAFKKVVDEALAKLMTSGEMAAIYNKWFMSPIPPSGRVIGLPLSAENQRLYAAPNDKSFE